MVVRLIIISSFLLLLPLLTSGSSTDSIRPFSQIEKRVRSGEKEALRELAFYLDSFGIQAQKLLEEYTLFQPREVELRRRLSVNDFLSFYDEYEDKIHFSPLLAAYYITPVENRNSSYDLHHLKSGNSSSYEASSPESEIEYLIEKAQVNPASDEVISRKNNLVSQAILKKENSIENLLQLCELFTWFRDKNDIELILYWVKTKKLTALEARPFLEKITNKKLVPDEKLNRLYRRYRQFLRKTHTVENGVAEVYTTAFPQVRETNSQAVDYYGEILSLAPGQPHFQFNAIKDLIRTRHPKALFYIASQVYRYRNEPEKALWSAEEYSALLEKLTETRLGIQHSSGLTIHEDKNWKDRHALRNFLFYWANRHGDYAWDKNAGYFVNGRE